MRTSYLIQRLQKPFKGTPKNVLEQVMANGLQVTGFNEECRNILRQICVFDYMGSAEFEFGAIPKTFAQLIEDRSKLIAKEVIVPYHYASYREDKKEGYKTVYVICRAEDETEILKRITLFAVDNLNYTPKERVLLNEAMTGSDYRANMVGWLELDNGYMFFIDETMFKNFCGLLDIKKKGEK